MTPNDPNIRLIGFDLDGTVLNSSKELTPRTAAAIRDAIAAGMVALPATGRTYTGVPNDVLAIPGLRYALVSNGAAIFEQGRLIYQNCLSVEDTLALIRLLAYFDAEASVYIDGAAYNEFINYDSFGPLITAPMRRYFLENRIVVPNLAAFVRQQGRPVEKLAVLFRAMPERERTRQALEATGLVTVSSSLDMNLEVNARTANKGAALLALAERLGIPQSGVMAIGDGDNDLEMLRAAGRAVAMGNAVPEVLALAGEVTGTEDEDGVAQVLERLIKAQRPARKEERR